MTSACLSRRRRGRCTKYPVQAGFRQPPLRCSPYLRHHITHHRLYQTSHEPVATQTQIEAPHSLHSTPVHNPPCTPINRLSRRLSEALEHDLQAIALSFLHRKSNENSRVTAAEVILGLLECFETWETLVVDLRMEGHWFFETRVAVSCSTVSDCIGLVD